MIHRRLFAKGIKYYLTLPHNAGHGIHSPSLFRLINEVLSRDLGYNVSHKIENYRQTLIRNSSKIEVLDLGANRLQSKKYKRIKDIAQNESTSDHYGKLLFNLVLEYKPKIIIELGTSLGIGTLYLALANSNGNIYTIEGSPEKASLASSMLQQIVSNVKVISGNFDYEFPKLLAKTGNADFIFIDGNHTKECTLRYFKEALKYSHSGTILVFDDINWSPGMMGAWKEIQKHEKVRVCLDLFRMGIVLMHPGLQKENFTVFY